MAAVNPQSQSLVIAITVGIVVCLHAGSSLASSNVPPYNGVEVVTYGEPCHLSRQLPIRIEEPAKAATESVLVEPSSYRPLKLNYRMISAKSNLLRQPHAEYPIAVQVPQVPRSSEAITPDPFRQGKSYGYNIEALPPSPLPIMRKYDFHFRVPPSPKISTTPTPHTSVKLLTGLSSRIDRVLIPACESPSSSCCKSDAP